MGFFSPSVKINVIYRNGVKDRISTALLSTLIDSKQIDHFERSSGWVKLELDPVRGMGGAVYYGTERRIG
jgi:hypothetical protein